jgi:GNAT superfamily N-acetyltransferase
LTTPGDDKDCGALIAINSRAYGMDLAASGDIVGRSSFWKSQFPVVGMKEGTPVSCAAVTMVDGHRYVALVATDPGHQRRGYAEAAMRAALEASAARHGDRPTVLHATEAGRPVYERMGYRPIASHTLFMERRFLAEH